MGERRGREQVCWQAPQTSQSHMQHAIAQVHRHEAVTRIVFRPTCWHHCPGCMLHGR